MCVCVYVYIYVNVYIYNITEPTIECSISVKHPESLTGICCLGLGLHGAGCLKRHGGSEVGKILQRPPTSPPDS